MSEVTWSAPCADGPVDALIRVPGSKSLTARWLLLAALAQSPTVLREPLVSRDTRIMQDCLTQLGVRFRTEDAALHVQGLHDGALLDHAPPGDALSDEALPDDALPGGAAASGGARPTIQLHVGLAGTVMRFVPFLAALQDADVRLDGDAAALARPMGPVVAALRAQGVEVTEHGEPGRLPLTVHGRGSLPGGLVEIDASASSQFVSALLLVGARARRELVVRHVGDALPSLPHIEMTLAVLRRAGVRAEHRRDPEGRHEWSVRPGPVRIGEVVVEPDLSNAGPFLAAAMVAGGTIAIADWPESTTQPGDSYRELLARMGGRVARDGQDLALTGDGTIHGLDADLSATGELAPTIAALAALADSPSHLRGIGHLRGHETDRITALATELDRLGARTVEHPDSLEIHPGALHGAVVETYEDHRIATAAAIIGLRVPGVQVVNVETTAKTLPDFVGMWLSMLHTDAPAGRIW